jgi:hypothetical protein
MQVSRVWRREAQVKPRTWPLVANMSEPNAQLQQQHQQQQQPSSAAPPLPVDWVRATAAARRRRLNASDTPAAASTAPTRVDLERDSVCGSNLPTTRSAAAQEPPDTTQQLPALPIRAVGDGVSGGESNPFAHLDPRNVPLHLTARPAAAVTPRAALNRAPPAAAIDGRLAENAPDTAAVDAAVEVPIVPPLTPPSIPAVTPLSPLVSGVNNGGGGFVAPLPALHAVAPWRAARQRGGAWPTSGRLHRPVLAPSHRLTAFAPHQTPSSPLTPPVTPARLLEPLFAGRANPLAAPAAAPPPLRLPGFGAGSGSPPTAAPMQSPPSTPGPVAAAAAGLDTKHLQAAAAAPSAWPGEVRGARACSGVDASANVGGAVGGDWWFTAAGPGGGGGVAAPVNRLAMVTGEDVAREWGDVHGAWSSELRAGRAKREREERAEDEQRREQQRQAAPRPVVSPRGLRLSSAIEIAEPVAPPPPASLFSSSVGSMMLNLLMGGEGRSIFGGLPLLAPFGAPTTITAELVRSPSGNASHVTMLTSGPQARMHFGDARLDAAAAARPGSTRWLDAFRHPNPAAAGLRLGALGGANPNRGLASGMGLQGALGEALLQEVRHRSLFDHQPPPANLRDGGRTLIQLASPPPSSDVENCPICLDGDRNQPWAMCPSCRNSAHLTCAQRWLRDRATCPICRAHIP